MPLSLEDRLVGRVGGFDPDPANWGPIYSAAAKQYGIPEAVLRGLTQMESQGHVSAQSKAGAEGAQQIMPENKGWLGIINSHDPRESIPAAAKYLRTTLDNPNEANGDLSKALAYYVGGPDKSKWGPVTQAYPGKVLSAAGLSPSQPEAFSGNTITVRPSLEDRLVSRLGGEAVPPASGAVQGGGGPLPGIGAAVPAQGSVAVAPVGRPIPTPGAAQAAEPSVPTQAKAPTPLTVSAPSVSAPTAIPSQVPPTGAQWGPLQQFASGALLGYGPEVAAGANALKSIISGGVSPAALPLIYSQAKDMYANAQQDYEQANPFKGVMLGVGGSLPTTMAGVSGINAAGRVLSSGLGRALPYTADAIRAVGDFATGGGGQGSSGLTGFLARRASQALGGATLGAEAGAMQSHMSPEPTMEQVKRGALLGGGLGLATAPISDALTHVINPTVRPEIARLAGEYQTMLGGPKVPGGLRADQLTTSGLVNRLGKTLIGSDQQFAPFTQQVSRTMGGNNPSITQDVFQTIRDRIGDGLDRAALRTGIKVNRQFLNDLVAVRNDAHANVMLPIDSPELNTIDRMLNTIDHQIILSPNMTINGEKYQQLTGFDGNLGRLMRSANPTLREYAVKIRTVLDDALERSSPPDAIARLKELRQQWKNTIAAEDLVEKAQPSGLVNPRDLQGQVRKVYKNYGWRDPGDIGTLAEVGRLMEATSAQGGTQSSRFGPYLRHALEAMTVIGPGAAALGHPEEGLAVAALGGVPLAGMAGARALLQSNWYKNLLTGTALGSRAPMRLPPALIPAMTELSNDRKPAR